MKRKLDCPVCSVFMVLRKGVHTCPVCKSTFTLSSTAKGMLARNEQSETARNQAVQSED